MSLASCREGGAPAFRSKFLSSEVRGPGLFQSRGTKRWKSAPDGTVKPCGALVKTFFQSSVL